ncbi:MULTISPECIES: DMT family transporter [unclassified Campylobacter]|uniref:DMT family transporter n=1 Tax=unclassified Campylobacter TaxID=2593542 RepID=UPI001473A0F3|nr:MULTISPECIES: DMT family transporter [unclassified Campylobacter]
MLRAYLSLLAATFIVGFSFAFVKISLEFASVFESLAHRFSIAFIVVLILIKFGFINEKISLKDFKKISFIAILYPSLFFAFQAFGLTFTSSVMAGIFHACTPVVTMVFAHFFIGEYTNIWQKFFALVSVFGIIYIIYMSGNFGENSSLIGNFLIILSVIAISLYNVFARRVLAKFEISKLVIVTIFIGFIFFNMLNLSDYILKSRELKLYFAPFLDIKFTISTLFLAIFSSVATSFLFGYSLKRLEAFKIGIFSNLSTLVTIIAGIFLLDENFEIYHFLGASFIILGVVGVNLANIKRNAR